MYNSCGNLLHGSIFLKNHGIYEMLGLNRNNFPILLKGHSERVKMSLTETKESKLCFVQEFHPAKRF